MELEKLKSEARRMDAYPILRCLSCGRNELRTTLKKTGMCNECAGRKFRPAFRISDADVIRFEAQGFDFNDDEFFTDDPNYVPPGKGLPKIEAGT